MAVEQDFPGVALALSWADVDALTGELATSVRRDRAPEVIVGVLRGGMIPAVVLAHRLGVRDVRAVEITHTVDDRVHAAKTRFPATVRAESLGDVAGRDVLVVDDVAGSGETLAAAVELIERAGAARVRTAVWVVNADNWTQPQSPEATVAYIARTCHGWVRFPWEVS